MNTYISRRFLIDSLASMFRLDVTPLSTSLQFASRHLLVLGIAILGDERDTGRIRIMQNRL